MTSYADQFIPPPRTAPRWTKEKPTVPGWYWWKQTNIKTSIYSNPVMVEVVREKLTDKLVQLVQRPPGCFIDFVASGKWAGPLEPPEEDQ